MTAPKKAANMPTDPEAFFAACSLESRSVLQNTRSPERAERGIWDSMGNFVIRSSYHSVADRVPTLNWHRRRSRIGCPQE